MNGTHRARRRTAALLLGFFAAALLDAAPARAAEEPVRELIAVGQPIGVKLFSDGVLVIGFSDGDTAAKACGLKEGDIITALGGESLDTIEELRACLNANGGSGAVTHVLLDDPSRGYGIFIGNMLDAAGLSYEA